MGLFGSKKIFVSSSVKNLAGDVELRPDYLKSVVAAKTILDTKKSMGDMIRDSYLNGPGINLRSFYRWSQQPGNMNVIGVPTGTYLGSNTLDGVTIEGVLESMLGFPVLVMMNHMGTGDYLYWAEQWILENHPARIEEEWRAIFLEDVSDVQITFPDNTVYTFDPANYDPEAQYLYITYAKRELNAFGPNKLLIYKNGGGNASLDAILTISNDASVGTGYFPFIPVRLENEFLSDTNLPTAYGQARKAFRKAFKNNKGYKDIIKQISEVENLDDIDHAYIVFGPSVNVLDNASRNYIFEFFTRIYSVIEDMGEQGRSAYDDWVAEHELYMQDNSDVQDWEVEYDLPGSPGFGQPMPEVRGVGTLANKKIFIQGANGLPGQYQVEISWNAFSKVTGTGLGKPGANPGDVWFEQTLADGFETRTMEGWFTDLFQVDTHMLYKQITADSWIAYEIVGLTHRNYIYGGKYVEITLTEALDDEEESGFIIPLNYFVLKDMGLVDATQLATACCNVVFNSYKIVKTGLLGSLFFRIIVALVVAVVMNLVLPGSGTAIGGSIAASLGISGVAAVIVNAAITMLATMLISAVINPIARAVFGDKLGALIGALATFVASMYAGSFINTGSLAVNWGNMMTAENLMKLTTVVGDAYTAYLGAQMQGVLADTQKLLQDSQEDLKKIRQAYADEFGYGRGIIDPMMLTQSDRSAIETYDMFLSRTLLTGDDIVEMSLQMISEFPALTTSTDLPLASG